MNGRLVGPLVFKTSGTGDPRPVGSIPATSAVLLVASGDPGRPPPASSLASGFVRPRPCPVVTCLELAFVYRPPAEKERQNGGIG